MYSLPASSSLFGDDCDEDSDNEIKDNDVFVATALSNNLFIELMRIRTKKHSIEVIQPTVQYQNHVAILTVSDMDENFFVNIKRRLMERVTKELKIPPQYITENLFSLSTIDNKCYNINEESGFKVYDIIIFIGCIDPFIDDKNISIKTLNSSGSFENFIANRLLSGGRLLSLQKTSSCIQSLSGFVAQDTSSVQNGIFQVVNLRKRVFSCNNLGAAYWTHSWGSLELSREAALVDDLCIEVSVDEFRTGILYPSNHQKAVSCLREHGLCIFPSLFDPSEVLRWGNAAKEDMERVVHELWRSRELDLLHPYSDTEDAEAKGYGKYMENYYELSMREALRCDLRNGQAISTRTADLYGQPPRASDYSDAAALKEKWETFSDRGRIEPSRNIQYHPALLQILNEVMNQPEESHRQTADEDYSRGNWGLWNFGGEGPGKPPMPVVGQVGTVMSLPGCADQTIHADTAHIFTHTAHLPPHYLNLFAPAVPPSPDKRMGQTAFVVGSHRLKTSAEIMAAKIEEEEEEEDMDDDGGNGMKVLLERLVRPHLVAGDCLLFDCRILHFGLANQHLNRFLRANPSTSPSASSHPMQDESTELWRPMLYVNYHLSWFRDPKNWNNAVRLFGQQA